MVIMFDGDDEKTGDQGKEPVGVGMWCEDKDSIEKMQISIVKQENCEFTFRIVCNYCGCGVVV